MAQEFKLGSGEVARIGDKVRSLYSGNVFRIEGAMTNKRTYNLGELALAHPSTPTTAEEQNLFKGYPVQSSPSTYNGPTEAGPSTVSAAASSSDGDTVIWGS